MGLNEKVLSFDKNCVNYMKVLTAAQKMTTHTEADNEVAALKTRYDAVKGVSNTWVAKSGFCLTTPSLNLTPGLPRISRLKEKTSFHWRKWSQLLESLKTFLSKRKSLLKACEHYYDN